MAIVGSGLSDKNIRLRFLTYIFLGILALGLILYWKSQLFLTTEYVEFDTYSHQLPETYLLKSNNYQIETFDSSPTVR